MNGAPRRGDAAWFNKADMARIFDCSPQAFDQYVRPHAPPEAIRRHGNEIYFWTRRVVEAWAVRRSGGDDADPLLVSSKDSPALERYRQWRAEREKLEVLTRKRVLVPLGELQPALIRIAMQFRRAGEMLQRQYGPDAATIIEDHLAEAEREITQLVSPPEDANDPHATQTEVDDPPEAGPQIPEPSRRGEPDLVPGKGHAGRGGGPVRDRSKTKKTGGKK